MHAKTSWVAVAAGLVGLAIPASASGATQIGQVAPAGPADCGLTVNTVQAATGGPPSYEVPAPGGVITSWSVVESATPGAARLQLWSGGGTSYVLEGRSNLETTAAGSNTFQTQIPAQAGALLGLRVASPQLSCAFTTALASDVIQYDSTGSSDAAPGEPPRFLTNTLTPRRLNVSATLEADCDSDGFGDETQDSDTSSCVPPTPDTASPDTTITKHPKDKTKKKTATFEFTGTDARAIASFQCSLDGAPFTACTSPHTVRVKKGKHTFEVRATDQAGNVGAPASDTWKRKKKK